MSDAFAASAQELAGLAAQLLGWKPQEFWQATPADFANALHPVTQTANPPTREDIRAMMEQDQHNG